MISCNLPLGPIVEYKLWQAHRSSLTGDIFLHCINHALQIVAAPSKDDFVKAASCIRVLIRLDSWLSELMMMIMNIRFGQELCSTEITYPWISAITQRFASYKTRQTKASTVEPLKTSYDLLPNSYLGRDSPELALDWHQEVCTIHLQRHTQKTCQVSHRSMEHLMLLESPSRLNIWWMTPNITGVLWNNGCLYSGLSQLTQFHPVVWNTMGIYVHLPELIRSQNAIGVANLNIEFDMF